ncbi:uncharacterized protein V6R79_020493 [Siganus canaliculatus]
MAEGVNINTNLSLSRDEEGHLKISNFNCSGKFSNIEVKFSGILGKLYNVVFRMLRRIVLFFLNRQICPTLQHAALEKVNSMLKTISMRSNINNYIGIDYSLIEDPVVTPQSLDMHFRGMFYDPLRPNNIPVNNAVDPVIRQYDRMVYLALSKNFFDSGLSAYYSAGLLETDITNAVETITEKHTEIQTLLNPKFTYCCCSSFQMPDIVRKLLGFRFHIVEGLSGVENWMVSGISGKEIEAMITKKCETYKENSQKDPNHACVDCKAFLDKFKSAFVNKDPNKITPESFIPLTQSYKLPEHKDKFLFWSGPDLFAWLFNNKNDYFYNLLDTVFGFLSISPVWCGKEGSKEIISNDNCPSNASDSYWRAASRAFAKAATGKVMVLLSDDVFYDSKSYFATDELPYFNSKKVTALRVLIVTTDATPGKCKDKRLVDLKKHAGALKKKYQCRQAKESDLKKKDPKDWWNTAMICRMAGGSGSVRMAVLLVAITVMLHSAQEVFGMNGKELEEHITESCNDYKYKTTPQKDPNHAKVNCRAFLNKFKSAFVNKNPKTMTPESYHDLMENFKPPEHKNKYLFWSGTKDMIRWLIAENKNSYFYHIHDTVFRFLDIDEAWCGKPKSKEIFTKGCPALEDAISPVDCYWKAASRAFAKAATGKVTVLLSDKRFYNSTSYFATDELPYLNSKKVTALRVLIVTTDATKGKCDHESLADLRKDAGALKNKYHCRQEKESDLKKKNPKDWWNTATEE